MGIAFLPFVGPFGLAVPYTRPRCSPVPPVSWTLGTLGVTSDQSPFKRFMTQTLPSLGTGMLNGNDTDKRTTSGRRSRRDITDTTSHRESGPTTCIQSSKPPRRPLFTLLRSFITLPYPPLSRDNIPVSPQHLLFGIRRSAFRGGQFVGSPEEREKGRGPSTGALRPWMSSGNCGRLAIRYEWEASEPEELLFRGTAVSRAVIAGEKIVLLVPG